MTRASSNTIFVPDGVAGYVDVVTWVLTRGKEVSPRGMRTREIEDATVFIEDVYNTLPVGTNRGVVPGIGAVEACQLLGSASTPDLVIAIGPQFKSYVEDNGLFHGAYGLRTLGQYEQVVSRLKSDPDTRQAVVTLWDPQLDLLPSKRDYPCTVLHQFRIRDGRLNMSVYMRSNDVWLGAAYDWFQFTRVQIAMASVLGVEPGTYAHHVGSLHIYEQHFDRVSELRHPPEGAERQPPRSIVASSWEDVVSSARRCLDAAKDEVLDNLSEDERWYASAMIDAAARNKSKEIGKDD